jgi:hypothetical protein
MRRISRAATLTAVVGYAFGLVALLLDFPFAIPAFIVGTTAVAIALFTGFRSSHLRDINEPPPRS